MVLCAEAVGGECARTTHSLQGMSFLWFGDAKGLRGPGISLIYAYFGDYWGIKVTAFSLV